MINNGEIMTGNGGGMIGNGTNMMVIGIGRKDMRMNGEIGIIGIMTMVTKDLTVSLPV
ncbi:MAG: hypothetical protein ABFC84_06735 [Veillonellales bacterium]